MKKRTRRKPLPLKNPLHLLEGKEKVPSSYRTTASTLAHMGLDDLLNGRGDPIAWSRLAVAICVGSYFSLPLKIYPEADSTFHRAWDCLLNAAYRHREGKTMGFTGLERKIVIAAIAIHDDQLDHATIEQYDAAVAHAESHIHRLDYAQVAPTLRGLRSVSDDDIYLLSD